MDSTPKLTDFVLKTMDFTLKMMDFPPAAGVTAAAGQLVGGYE